MENINDLLPKEPKKSFPKKILIFFGIFVSLIAWLFILYIVGRPTTQGLMEMFSSIFSFVGIIVIFVLIILEWTGYEIKKKE